MSKLIHCTLAAAMLAGGAALAKLPPPTPEEQAATAEKKAKEEEQKQREQASLTKVQDRIAKQYHKEHGTHPSAGAGEKSSTVQLPKNVKDRPGQGGPDPSHPFSQEAHSAPAK
jgi:hypothetical protein